MFFIHSTSHPDACKPIRYPQKCVDTKPYIFKMSECHQPKGIVHLKMSICLTFTVPQAIQDVDKFFLIRTNLEKLHGCRQN